VDLYDRIAGGEFPDTSMGAKVPYDRCSICNHYARSPADYCVHVRQGASPPYGMRAILGDGRMCGVYNDYPRFFDDSYVFIGAERSAKVMTNVTSMLRGSRTYTNRLFQPGGVPLSTREVRADAPASPYDERNERLGLAVAGVINSRVRGPNESRVGEAISQVLSAVPVPKNDAEAQALRHAEETVRRQAAVRDRTISEDEYRFWENKEVGELEQAHNVSQAQRDRAIALLRSRMDKLPTTEKLGTIAKWATLTKQIPVPSSTQRALLRDHTGRLTPVLPQAIYDECSSSMPALWSGLSSLASLGIVMRPDEFQGCALRAMHHDLLADACDEHAVVFEPTPLDQYHEPRWLPRSPNSGALQRILSMLGPVLQGRSFAPRIVAVRISIPPPPAAVPSRTPHADPTLNEISQLYNEYRTGLLTRDSDWSYVPAVAQSGTLSTDSKVADAANIVSSLLLHLAYW